MALYHMFYNGKSQPCAAGRLGTALIYPVEPFKYTFLIGLGDADSGIFHRQTHMIIFSTYRYYHISIRTVIADGITDQIIQQFLHHLTVRLHFGWFTGKH